jgi:LL-diaminopimelate aminotransferase
MAGRTGRAAGSRYAGLVYLDGNEANGYVPAPPAEAVDLVYLCSPNNPTGAVMTKSQLKAWVDYARANRAIILFDAAYEAFVRDPALPRSIYEIEGARDVAIEFRSFSKTAGFTGTRCAFAVVPKTLKAIDAAGKEHAVHAMWNRRHTTKFNGVSYPVQRAAEAVFSPEGRQQCEALIQFYLENARLIREAMTKLGFSCTGGVNAPYVWVRTGRDSWEFFDQLLNQAGVVCTPGVGFGRCGQGCVRFSAFNSRPNVEEAMERVRAALA